MSRTSNAHIDISTIQLILLHFEIGTRCLITNSSPMMSAEQRRSSKDLQCTPFEAHTQTHFYINHSNENQEKCKRIRHRILDVKRLNYRIYFQLYILYSLWNTTNTTTIDRIVDLKMKKNTENSLFSFQSAFMREFLEFFVWNKSSKKM